jgi:hypothetical protein
VADADADADADPWLYYSTHGFFPGGYSHYGGYLGAHHGYRGFGNHFGGHYGYSGLGYYGGYGHGYYGRKKREAEAEADAEADPYLLYGAYGHSLYGGHYGYGYAHTPYHYLGGGCRNYLGGLVPCAGK